MTTTPASRTSTRSPSRSASAVRCAYEVIRSALVANGLMSKVSRRRLFGRSEVWLPKHPAYPVRPRTLIGDAARAYTEHEVPRHRAEPDTQCVALCGLVAALELVPFLYQPTPNDKLARALRTVVNAKNGPAITAITTFVDATRGDLAVAAMR